MSKVNKGTSEEVNIDDIMAKATKAAPRKKPTQQEKPTLVKVNAYCLGGAGVKIVAGFGDASQDFLNIVAMDTSTSEDALLPPNAYKHTFSGKGGMGSGGLRSTQPEFIIESATTVMPSTNPTRMNYVIFSGSGASGSVASLPVVKYLIEHKKDVICFISIKTNTSTRRYNALNTLTVLHELAVSLGVTIPVYIADEDNLKEQDKQTRVMIGYTYSLLSPSIVGIDDKDRSNFLNISALGIKPSLASLLPRYMPCKFSPASTIVLTDIGDNEDVPEEGMIYNGAITPSIHSYLEDTLNVSPDQPSLAVYPIPPYMLIQQLSKQVNDDASDKQESNNVLDNAMNEIGSGDIEI